MGIFLVLAACMTVATWLGYQAGKEAAVKAAPCPIPCWPLPHVVFDPESSDEDRLGFLELAAQAIRDGRLRQTEKLGNDAAGDKSE